MKSVCVAHDGALKRAHVGINAIPQTHSARPAKLLALWYLQPSPTFPVYDHEHHQEATDKPGRSTDVSPRPIYDEAVHVLFQEELQKAMATITAWSTMLPSKKPLQ